MTTINLEIPYPPSINTYWGFHGHRRFLTNKAVQFKKDVAHQVSLQPTKTVGDARVEVTITLCPPDKRVRDIDNSVKSCFDSLVQANVMNDDSQIDILVVQRGEQIKGGKALVTINTL
jgi:crossover junction endodeoxyribonuclease RusA